MTLTPNGPDPLHELDNRLALNELGALMRRNSERWFPEAHATEWPATWFYAIGLGGEAGEVLNLVKKEMRDGADITNRLDAELADTFAYLLLLADERGIDLIAALRAKVYECERRWGNQ